MAEALWRLEAVPLPEPARSQGEARRIWARKASFLLTLARPAEAEAILRGLLEAASEPELRRELARSLLAQGRAAEALAVFESLSPSEREAVLLEYGEALLATGEAKRAAAALAAVLIRDPWRNRAYLALGRLLVRRGEKALGRALLERYRALEIYERRLERALVLESEGRTAEAYLVRGRIERERGRLFEALASFTKAVAEEAKLGEAWIELSRLARLLERPFESIAQLERLPRKPPVLRELALAYEALGDAERAQACRKALEQEGPGEGDRSSPQAGRARDPAATELRARARRRQRGKPLSDSTEELLLVAEALRREGDLRSARAVLELAVRLRPREPRYRLAFAALHGTAGDLPLRLWALWPGRRMWAREALERDLAALGLEVEEVEALLAEGEETR